MRCKVPFAFGRNHATTIKPILFKSLLLHSAPEQTLTDARGTWAAGPGHRKGLKRLQVRKECSGDVGSSGSPHRAPGLLPWVSSLWCSEESMGSRLPGWHCPFPRGIPQALCWKLGCTWAAAWETLVPPRLQHRAP